MDVSILKNNELVDAYSSIVKELKKETSFVQKMFLEIWQNTLQLNSTEIHPKPTKIASGSCWNTKY